MELKNELEYYLSEESLTSQDKVEVLIDKIIERLKLKTKMTDKQRILSEIEWKYNEWRLGNSAEAKYRCEAYKELIELIKPIQEEPVSKIIFDGNFNKSWYAHPELAFKAGAKWQYEQFEKIVLMLLINRQKKKLR